MNDEKPGWYLTRMKLIGITEDGTGIFQEIKPRYRQTRLDDFVGTKEAE